VVNKLADARIGRSSLVRGVGWSLAGLIVYAAAQWAAVILIARAGPSDEVGAFFYWSSIFSPTVLLLSFKLRAIIATDANHDFELGHYLAVRVFSCVLSLLIIVGVLVATWGNVRLSLILMFVGIGKIIEAGSDILQGYMQQSERQDLVASSRFVKGLVQLVLMSVAFFVAQDAVVAVLVWMLGGLLSFLIFDIPVCMRLGCKRLRPVWEAKALIALVRLALPMGIASGIGSLVENVPRYFVQHHLGLSHLGYFAAIATLTFIGSTILTAMVQAVSPRLARLYAFGDYRGFDRILVGMCVVSASVGVIGTSVAYFFGEPILELVYGYRYREYNFILVGLMLVLSVRAVFLCAGTAIQAMRNFGVHFKIDAVMLLILSLSCFLLVPALGLVGVISAMLVTSLVEGILYAAVFVKLRRARGVQSSVAIMVS
jgi:O-antigen/teichoic acid export membrane protein